MAAMVGPAVVEVVEVVEVVVWEGKQGLEPVGVVWEVVVLVPATADALTSLAVVVVGVVEWVGVPEWAQQHWRCAEGCAGTF